MDLESLRIAAQDTGLVQGLTHNFYRYPARFSPQFAQAALQCFSKPGDVVLDPFMGGGTTVVEGAVAGRRAIGSDINSLSVFVTRIKTTSLTRPERDAVTEWCRCTVARMMYNHPTADLDDLLIDARTANLQLPQARSIKKAIAVALSTIEDLSSNNTRDFVRGVLLHTGQWALDNRKRATPITEFRQRFADNCESMLRQLQQFRPATKPTLIHCPADDLPNHRPFKNGTVADLVVTSPPYPGIHMLYHRWQVDGRRETPAPFWIADCHDGEGGSFYTFGDRRQANLNTYFERFADAMTAIRSLLKRGGTIVQMVSFSNKSAQLPRFLAVMQSAGFSEMRRESGRPFRVWREVPNRKWHANSKGETPASREVVLVHRAI